MYGRSPGAEITGAQPLVSVDTNCGLVYTRERVHWS